MNRSVLALAAAAAVGCAPSRLVPPLRYEPGAVAPDDAFRATAPAVPPVSEAASDEPRTTFLPNGLRVVLVERHDFPVVAASLVVDRGAVDLADVGGRRLAQTWYLFGRSGDEATAEGLSRRAAASGIVIRGGAYAKAWVTARGPAASLDAALGALADFAYRTRLAPDEYRRRAAEWQESERAGGTSLFQAERRILFGDAHPYGYVAPTGKVLALAEAQELHDRLFQPAQATLVVAGDVTPDQLDVSVAGAFGGWAAGTPLPAQLGVPPSPPAPRVSIVIRRGLAQMPASLFARGPSPDTDDHLGFLVVARLLGGAKSSSLFEQLRETTGAAYAVSSTVTELPPVSWLTVRASYDTDKAVDGVKAALEAIRNLRSGKVTEEQVAVARETLLADWRSTMSTVEGVAAAYAWWSPRNPALDPRTIPVRLARIGPAQIARMASEYLKDSALHVVFMGEDRWLDVSPLGMGPDVKLEMPN